MDGGWPGTRTRGRAKRSLDRRGVVRQHPAPPAGEPAARPTLGIQVRAALIGALVALGGLLALGTLIAR